MWKAIAGAPLSAVREAYERRARPQNQYLDCRWRAAIKSLLQRQSGATIISPKRSRRSHPDRRSHPSRSSRYIAVSLSVANHHASLPVAWRLYLPQSWADDPARRCQAGVPDAVRFQTKPEIACDQLRAACAAGLPGSIVLMDAGYGDDTWLRSETTSLGLQYIAGVRPHTSVWPPGTGRLPPKKWRGRGRPPTRLRRRPGSC